MRSKHHPDHIHNRTRHNKLRGPDWFVSALMLDRTIDAIARRLTINHHYHIPYLAGYSTSGTVIYIDRDLPRFFKTSAGKKVDVHRYLLLHEAVEKALLDAFGLHYQHAHQIALRAEEAAVHGDGISWQEYDSWMQTYIKIVEEEAPLDLPPDLDLTPYIDEHDKELLKQMKSWMKAHKSKPQTMKPKAKKRVTKKA